VEAALTGHLVLSTLHTNDAPSAMTRLAEMGIDPFLIGSAVDVVVAQRLARRLCERCREPYQPSPADLITAGLPFGESESLPVLYRPAGCSACARTGYRGRIALFEVMGVTEEIERLVSKSASGEELRRVAAAQGMRTLRDDGLDKVVAGLTTMEEIARVVV
jgi:type IV pilus assembly protein PilB